MIFKDQVEKNFAKILNQIDAGLPEVQDIDEIEGSDGDDDLKEMNEWTCPCCTTLNRKENLKCQTCQTEKPKIGNLQT